MIDWTHYEQLEVQGLGDRAIARHCGILWGSFHREEQNARADRLYVDLIERYAKAAGVGLEDVGNLAFHELFERWHYLPQAEL